VLRFLIFQGGKPAQSFPLEGAYLIGSDHVPIRSELQLVNGELRCQRRAQGPAALAVLWPVKGAGRIMLETTRLLDRERPYNLHLELARGQMMRIHQKREDWGLFDVENVDHFARTCSRAQDTLIEAIKCSDVAGAAAHADQVLSEAINLGEKMALFHAGVFLSRRRQEGRFSRRLFGCTVNLDCRDETYRKRLLNGFDFAILPLSWRLIEPKQGEYNWEPLDTWVQWLTAQRLPIQAGPLISFQERHIPDWLYIYEHDFETTRDFLFEHIRRVLNRYGNRIQVWTTACGLHANNTFNFNFEQLMELTRMGGAITKQMVPGAVTLVDLVAPWGEYYARNPRTIPPLLYADMLVQNNVNFDAFGLQLMLGVAVDGMFVRDVFQISSMLDRFATLGRSLHLTAVQAPSAMTRDDRDAWSGALAPGNAGCWHDEWSEALQSRWLRETYNVALSKPFVESVSWNELADYQNHFLPHGGLLRPDLSPKMAYEQLCTIRAQIHANSQTRPPQPL
jgi:hypothetical protein